MRSSYYKRWSDHANVVYYYKRGSKELLKTVQVSDPSEYPESVRRFLLNYGQKQFLADKTAKIFNSWQDEEETLRWNKLLQQGITHEKTTTKRPKNFSAWRALVDAGQQEAADALLQVDRELAAYIVKAAQLMQEEKERSESDE